MLIQSNSGLAINYFYADLPLLQQIQFCIYRSPTLIQNTYPTPKIIIMNNGLPISGSIIQNSAKCRVVCETSALNVGPNVYTFDKAQA